MRGWGVGEEWELGMRGDVGWGVVVEFGIGRVGIM